MGRRRTDARQISENQSLGETSTSSVFDRIRAKIDAFDSIRNDSRESRVVVKLKIDENDRNRKKEKKMESSFAICLLLTSSRALSQVLWTKVARTVRVGIRVSSER